MTEPAPPESLGDSFRQSKRELFVMLGTWIVFVIWITSTGALLAFRNPGAEVPTVLGMPSWVFYTVGLPWLVADVWIIWFALKFMKDTSLEAIPTPSAKPDA